MRERCSRNVEAGNGMDRHLSESDAVRGRSQERTENARFRIYVRHHVSGVA